MDTGIALREARERGRLTQAELARRAGTSQATISAYENGRKHPSVETLARLLSTAGARLTVEHGHHPVLQPSAAQDAKTARALADVIALAEALPTRHERELHYPRLRAA
jgi:transcriptional regulator with XRE-family HTH domain